MPHLPTPHNAHHVQPHPLEHPHHLPPNQLWPLPNQSPAAPRSTDPLPAHPVATITTGITDLTDITPTLSLPFKTKSIFNGRI